MSQSIDSDVKQIFLCHAGEDKQHIVSPLYEALLHNGIDAWYDEAEIKWGDSLTEKVNWGLARSKYVVVVLSKWFIDKGWPNRELHSALNMESSGEGLSILPLLVGNADDIERIRAQYPLINDKKFLHWDTTPISDILFEVARLLIPGRRPPQGDYKEPTVDSPPPIITPDIAVNSIASTEGHEIVAYAARTQSANNLPITESSGEFIRNPDWVQLATVTASAFSTAEMIARGDFVHGLTLPFLYQIDVSPDLIDPALDILNSATRRYNLKDGTFVPMLSETIWQETTQQIASHLSYRSASTGFALSHFGMGYSSLSWIRDTPPTYLIIAPQFLSESDSEDLGSSIVRAIGHIGDSLGISVVAPFSSERWSLQQLSYLGVSMAVMSEYCEGAAK